MCQWNMVGVGGTGPFSVHVFYNDLKWGTRKWRENQNTSITALVLLLTILGSSDTPLNLSLPLFFFFWSVNRTRNTYCIMCEKITRLRVWKRLVNHRVLYIEGVSVWISLKRNRNGCRERYWSHHRLPGLPGCSQSILFFIMYFRLECECVSKWVTN